MSESHAVAYHALRSRVREVLEQAGPDAGSRSAPATPEWTVHDVLAHLVGVSDDVTNGRLDGVASDAWTAKQVELRRDKTVGEMLAEWDEQGPLLEKMLGEAPEEIAGQALFDAVTHEQDIRHALGVRGARDCDALVLAWDWIVAARTRGGGTALRFVTDAGDDVVSGAGTPVATVQATRFEILRACAGRRSAGEIAGYGWDPSPEPELLLAAAFFTLRAEPLAE